MKKIGLFLALGVGVLLAQEVAPAHVFGAKGNVLDIVVQEKRIIAGTDAGSIETFDLETKAQESVVVFDGIKDFMGNPLAAKVYSVDVLRNGTTFLAVVQGQGSFRELYIVREGVKERVLDASAQLMIKKAKFVSSKQVLLGLMSNELLLYDVEKKAAVYRFQINQSHFSDFALNETKTLAVTSDESGEIALVDVMMGKVLQTYKGGNVDNVYKVDFKKERILTAGQDRRGIVYERASGRFERFNADFLIYAGALSPSSNLGAWAFTENNAIAVFDLQAKTQRYTLEGQRSTMNTIVFVDEKTLVSGSDDPYIMLWRLP